MKPVSLTASATLNRRSHGGGTVVLNAAAGLTVTLPASSGSGDEYEIIAGTTVTSNDYIVKVGNGTDVIAGVVSIVTDIAGVNMLATGTDDTITMNGGTKGGLLGSRLVLKDYKAGFWGVRGDLLSTSTEASPFSATVS